MKLHPLEVLALNSLPWEARVARVASYVLTGKLGATIDRKLRPDDAKKIIVTIGEPWGRKGKFAKALVTEHDRQRVIRKKRSASRRKAYSCRVSDYDPDFAQYNDWNQKQRRNALVRKRIGTGYRNGLGRAIRWQRNHVPCRNFRDTHLARGAYFAVIRPSAVKTPDDRTLSGYVWLTEHKIRYLFYKVGSAEGALRVPADAETVLAALRSLERGEVSRARKKSYDIEVDWERRCFRIKSPRRRKWREVPFKEAKRRRRR